MIFLWIFVAIIVFSFVILLHEYWHFKAARVFWVKVKEFWFGLPPRAKKIKIDKKWTIYSLNYIPLWGFVRLAWESPIFLDLYDKDKNKLSSNEIRKKAFSWDDIFDNKQKFLKQKDRGYIKETFLEYEWKESFANKSYYKKSIILLAWVFMNFLLAWIIFSILFMIWVKPIWINDKIETNLDIKIIPTFDKALESWLLLEKSWVKLYPLEDSIAYKAGIRDWDIVRKVENTLIRDYEILKNIIKENFSRDIKFYIERSFNCDNSWKCEIENIEILVKPSEKWLIWSYLSPNFEVNNDFIYKYWFFESIKYGFLETYNQSILTFKALWFLLEKITYPDKPEERKEAINSISWPIGMADLISKSVSWGIVLVLIITAVLSINLWIFNLLPLPALDWWRFFMLSINSFFKLFIRKNIIWDNAEWLIHAWFFIFLIVLSIIIAYNDINKIINN